MADLPLPRLTTKRPRYEGGVKPTIQIKIGKRGKRDVRSAGGQKLERVEGGGPVAQWEIPGRPESFRSRRAAMRARPQS